MFKPIDPKPDFPKLEEEVLKFWDENHIFEKSLEQTAHGKLYTFYDGPPFATGLPHYGHILASTVKDVFPRFHTMKGEYVRRRWGWDTHGLPIEEIVERKLGISGKKDIEKLGIDKFNEICRSMVLEFAHEWRKMVRRIARWIDFDNSYKTMDRDYMESVWWAFKQIYDKGLIYEGRRVLLYCPRCETPVSNFEVAMDNSYKEVTEEAVTIKFKVKPGQKIGDHTVKPEDKIFILAWTTTPWTLPGNVALAVGEDIKYAALEKNGEYLIAAVDRLKDLKLDGIKIKNELSGQDLVGLEYEPLFDVPGIRGMGEGGRETEFKVYAADFVTTEDGTGIVHTAVVYGEDDYNLGLQVGLPVVPLLDEKGKFNAKAPELVRGMYFKDSEKVIKKDLESRGLLFAKNSHTHSYPHCWRCGTTLYYNAIPAWFMNIQKIKPGLLKTNDKEINWYPEHLKHGRYEKSVEAAPDWNISRNRYWGNPIPVWKCAAGHNTIVGSIKELGLEKNTFYFMRHGQAENNVLGISDCWPDTKFYPLTEEGQKQAHAAADRLKDLGIDMIFASDITRDKQTAEVVAKTLGVEVAFDERLREIAVGSYNGRTYAEFTRDFPWEGRWENAPEGGENLKQVQDRMVSFVNETNNNLRGKKILVISHGDPIWSLMSYFGSEREYPKYADPFQMDVSIADLHRPYIDEIVIKCQECGQDARRTPEIFDSWVEAGSMPFAEYHYPFEGEGGKDKREGFKAHFPAQFVAEYIAQTRAWFYVMHVVSYNLFDHAPFQNVVTTGTILAEDGSKMSKSKNNFPDPWKVIDQYGVDALRFYLMNSTVMQADNLNFSERELGITYRKNILILWNVFNYFVTYANEALWQPKGDDYKPELKNILDFWIVAKTSQLIGEVTNYLDKYDTVRATRAIENYINELSTWYLRRSRGRKDNHFFGTLRHCLLVLSKLMAPLTPYIAEIIYKNLKPEAESVHLMPWPQTSELSDAQQDLLAQMDLARMFVEQGHAVRKTQNIKLRQPLASVTYSGQTKLPEALQEVLAEELNVKKVLYEKGDESKLAFDTQITPQLKKEGLAAELTRAVQEMRKQAGLKVGKIVNLTYDTDDDELIAAFELFDKSKTYVNQISRASGGEETEINGKKVSLGLKIE